MVSDHTRPRWATIIGGLLVLDIALTFQNIWPTPAVWWTGGVSVELGATLLVLTAIAAWRGQVPRWLTSTLAILGVVLVFGRYAIVTSPALFGRDVNLYWDLRFVPDVVAMMAQPASWAATIGAIAAVLIVPYALFRLLRWGVRAVADGAAIHTSRRRLAIVGLAIVALFGLQRGLEARDEWQGYSDHRLFGLLDFPVPVTATYANQARVLVKQLSGQAVQLIGDGPSLDVSLQSADGADVFIFFVESYGAVAYDRPEIATPLAAARQRLAGDIANRGFSVASAFVESPTFGGGSWLAHISLMTGIEVRDEDTNQVLLTQKRDSLVTAFARRGYRTVAVMPGLQRGWPEGGFYGFDTIYNEKALNYLGPQFGWWVVPDQVSLARLDEFELRRADRQATFAFMAGVSTHTPFSPTAPYQPDWQKVVSKYPYSPTSIDEAYDQPPDWFDLGPSYTRAMEYVYATLGGYLEQPRTRDLVLIVIGDHQPPALVTGLGAPWDVPVHVITTRADVLSTLTKAGFSPGLNPRRERLSRMHELTPLLLRALSGEPTRRP